MKLFNQLKSLIAVLKEISALLQQLQQQQATLTEQLKHVQNVGEEVQIDIEKMNFKNIQLRKDIYGNDRMIFANR